MVFRTLRWRITLWYALTLAVILAASGVFWHFHLAQNILRQTDEHLLVVVRSVNTLLDGQETTPELCGQFRSLVQRHRWDEYIQILDAGGEILCTTENLDEVRLPVNSPALQHALEGISHFETVPWGGKASLRQGTFPVGGDGAPKAIIQAAETLEALDRALANLHFYFLVLSPLVLLALCVGGWYLAGRALSPMTRMARTARAIHADNLSLRLPVEHPGDEIATLAESVNAMLARLEESFRKVKQFSGDASHELRTPLAILRGETEVTLRWAREAEDYRRTLESNLEEINRMGRIIDDLLTLAKSDAGEMTLEVKEISLSDLLQELYLAGNTLGEGKDIRVHLHLDVAEEIRIRGDELRLRQMFLNLISNAVKYTDSGGRVDITLSVAGEQAVVNVADSGIGIPPEHLPHIFDRFYRIDKARNRADGGTGLGLAITKGIAQAHEGRIIVCSTPGTGSTFTVYLPVLGPAPKK